MSRVFRVVYSFIRILAVGKAIINPEYTVDLGTIIARRNFSRIMEGVWMPMLKVLSKAISKLLWDIVLITEVGSSLRPSNREGKPALTIATN